MRFETVIFLILFGIYLGSLWYVPFRFGRLFSLRRSWWMYVLSFGSVGLMVFSMSHRHSSGSFFIEVVEFLAMTWMGVFMYILILLLLFELIGIFFKLPKKLSAVSILIVAFLLSGYAMWNASVCVVRHVEMPIRGLDKDLRIALLSDLHIGPARGDRYLKKIVDETNSHKPDLVLITGDMIDGNNTLDGNLLLPLKHLNAPVYFTTGNHEGYAGFDRALRMVENLAVRVLRNQCVETHGIQLIGMDYMRVDEDSFDMHSVGDRTLKEELPKIEISPYIPAILMFHNPRGVEVAGNHDIDLMLSGHTHAGQLFPATVVTKWIFKYNRGIFKFKNTTLYVSQGAGTVGPRMRLGTRNEITVLDLKPDFSGLKGDYLGQNPPGSIPEIFAPGLICNDEHEGSSGFLMDGNIFVFQKFRNRECHTFEMVQTNGIWGFPRQIPFWKLLVHNGDFIIAPDDQTMIFQVKEKVGNHLVSNIWKVQRSMNGWDEPEILPHPVNTEWDESFASETAKKTVYFFSNRPGGLGNFDLYYTGYNDGQFLDPVNIGAPLNTPHHEWDPFVSIDESCLIFCSTKPEGFGGDDLYISFRHNEQWEVAVNMGKMINSPRSENRPYITNDGKYFFFTSSKRGNRDIYWVDISFLEQFLKNPVGTNKN